MCGDGNSFHFYIAIAYDYVCLNGQQKFDHDVVHCGKKNIAECCGSVRRIQKLMNGQEQQHGYGAEHRLCQCGYGCGFGSEDEVCKRAINEDKGGFTTKLGFA